MQQNSDKQIERAISTLDKSATVQMLAHDRNLLFQFKKAERITAALYIITGSLSDTEPIRRDIREIGAALIKQVLSFRMHRSFHKHSQMMTDLITRLISFLDLAHIADLLSYTHLSLIKRELDFLLEIIEGRHLLLPETPVPPVFEKSFFEPHGLMDMHNGHNTHDKGVRYDNKKELDGVIGVREKKTPKNHKGRISSARILQEGRKARMIAILKEKGACVIKDISPIMRDCSEKSLQRLLATLARNGTIKTIGEKRWRRYALRTSPATQL